MKIILPMLFSLYISTQLYSTNITIIESKTGNAWAVQDTVWRHVAVGMGYKAEVVPQSTLDTIANLDTTDVLIVASSNVSFTSTNHLATIIKYVKSGRPVYIQSEYLASYQGNITFNAIMQEVGANFTWGATVSGELTPMHIIGSFATTPNAVTTLNYFNYGYSGTGTGVEKFLEYNGSYFGFCYTDPTAAYGTVITISDEDWAWQNKSPALMGNILYKLAKTTTTSLNEKNSMDYSLSVAPNPFSDFAYITTSHYFDHVTLTILNSNGQQVKQLKNISGQSILLNREHLPAGLYFIYLTQDNRIIGSDKIVIANK